LGYAQNYDLWICLEKCKKQKNFMYQQLIKRAMKKAISIDAFGRFRKYGGR